MAGDESPLQVVICLSKREYFQLCELCFFSDCLYNFALYNVKIIPLYKGRAFKIAYCYEVAEENLKLNRENSLAINIGMENLATCVTNFGTSGINLGKKTNQQFTQIPFGVLRRGKRIKRGLYRSKSGRLINADVNGAANILRKSKQKVNFERLCVGLLDRPTRIRVA